MTPAYIVQGCKTEACGKRNGTAFSLSSAGALAGVSRGRRLLRVGSEIYKELILFGGANNAAAMVMFAVVT